MQNSVIEPRHTRPEQNEDVAKAHYILQIYRFLFDLLGPHGAASCSTTTEKEASRNVVQQNGGQLPHIGI